VAACGGTRWVALDGFLLSGLARMPVAPRSTLLAALVVGVAASPLSAAELVVAWAPLAVSVEGYQIERRVDAAGNEFTPIARVGSDGLRFVDRSVSTGVRYCYRVRGVRGTRMSPPSPPLCNVAAEPAAPPEPNPAVSEPEPPAPRGEFREVKALRRTPPAYPPEAQLNGLSGWVKLIFTVTAEGTTRDIRVTAAEPVGVFEEAAIEAAQSFVYAPRLDDGVPVDRPNVETEITFTWIDRGGSLTTDRRSPVPR
jgi:TonB family protein